MTGSGEDEEESAAVQFPASAGLEGEEGDGAMAGDLRPRLLLLLFRETPGRGEEKGAAAARGRNGEARVWGAARALVGAREQVAEGPRRAPCRAIAFGEGAVTRTTVGPAGQRERRRGGLAGCALRARVVGDWAGPFGWPGCLPRV